jgi:hypothetical protein
MTYLVASAQQRDVAAVTARELRRLNAPVQLAVAAAQDVARQARDATTAALISLAPCRQGSPELDRWIELFATGVSLKVNPTHTLHAVDNLALSVLAIALANHAWALSLGGAAGMMWSALELVGERDEHEVLVVAGDQEGSAAPASAFGVALLFDREPREGERPMQLVAVERRAAARPAVAVPHAAAGACALLAALRDAPAGRFVYDVPAAHGDGLDDIAVVWELG